MEDIVHTPQRLTQGGAIQDRSLDELMLEAGQIASVSRTQIIEHDNFSLPLKVFNDVTADKAGPTCN